jgi:hypothetical protein
VMQCCGGALVQGYSNRPHCKAAFSIDQQKNDCLINAAEQPLQPLQLLLLLLPFLWYMSPPLLVLCCC